MNGLSSLRRIVFATAVFILLMTGCLSVMSTQLDSSTEQHSAPNQFPWRFVDHAFAVHCYNTVRCRVICNHFDFGPYKADEQPSRHRPDSTTGIAGGASHGGVRNFPPPAEVQWTSLDGVMHEARVDIGAIFKGAGRNGNESHYNFDC